MTSRQHGYYCSDNGGSPNVHSECRNAEDAAIQSASKQDLIVLPSGFCAKRDELLADMHVRDPHTNTKLLTELWERCMTSVPSAPPQEKMPEPASEDTPLPTNSRCPRGKYKQDVMNKARTRTQTKCVSCQSGRTTATDNAQHKDACNVGCGAGMYVSSQLSKYCTNHMVCVRVPL